jgi:hypothetical protein
MESFQLHFQLGTENILAEINLESMGTDKELQHFWGQKFENACSFVGGRIIVKQEKISTAERSWTNYGLGDVQRF